METDAIIVFVVFGLILAGLVVKNQKMIEYRRLYDEALKKKDKAKALEYGRRYHFYRTNGKAKNAAAAELMIENDMKAAGIK